MMTCFRVRSLLVLAALVAVTAAPAIVQAQESKSAALARELTKLLDDAKLESIAAKDGAAPDLFVAALYFPGRQLLVVAAKYSVPQLLVEKIAKKDYRDVYIDLHSASIPASKVFIDDLNANGLKPLRGSDEPFDTYEGGGKLVAFDNDWRRQQKMSEEDFMKLFTSADEKYAQMLSVLLAGLKKSS